MKRLPYLLIGLALMMILGLRPKVCARCDTVAPQGQPAYCSGEYAPGIVLVGLRTSSPSRAHLTFAEGEESLRAVLQEIGWGDEQFSPPRQLLFREKSVIYAVPVDIGQECLTLQALRNHPDVAFAELDHAVRATEVDSVTPNDPHWIYQWGPAKIEAPAAWEIITGTRDLVVAVVDTGIQLDHEDLAESLWVNDDEIPSNGLDDDNNGKTDDIHGWHFYDGGGPSPKEDNHVIDDHGHGTHVAGILGAGIDNNLGIAGIAGGSQLMVVKVLDASGNGWYSDLARGIAYATDNGARVINLSLGAAPSSETLQAAVNYARTRGTLVVAAAGNTGGSVLYPAACDQVLAVSATDQNNRRWSLSNRGPRVDVAAPGVDIYSTAWTEGCPTGYCYKSGTSMATPHVAGLAALLWSARPDLTVEQVAAGIISTAVDVNADTYPGRDDDLGWGRIAAGEALSATMRLPMGEFGVDLCPATLTSTSEAGACVPYTLTLRNSGTMTDAFSITLKESAWPTSVSEASIGPLGMNATATFRVDVTIPITVADGLTDTVTVLATSLGDSTVSATSQLTTTAFWSRTYLPLVHHN